MQQLFLLCLRSQEHCTRIPTQGFKVLIRNFKFKHNFSRQTSRLMRPLADFPPNFTTFIIKMPLPVLKVAVMRSDLYSWLPHSPAHPVRLFKLPPIPKIPLSLQAEGLLSDLSVQPSYWSGFLLAALKATRCWWTTRVNRYQPRIKGLSAQRVGREKEREEETKDRRRRGKDKRTKGNGRWWWKMERWRQTGD